MADSPAQPTRRNALVTFLIPVICFGLAFPLGGLLGTTALRFAPNAALLAGGLIFAIHALTMVREMNAITGDTVVWWHVLIPFYGLYVAAIVVPKHMAKAMQLRGKGPPRSAPAYLLLFLWAFASDLNELT